MSKEPNLPDNQGEDENELIRSEFDAIVEGLSLDESSPTTYLDELDSFDRADRFIAPAPPAQSLRATFLTAKTAIMRWFKRGHHDDDGTRV